MKTKHLIKIRENKNEIKDKKDFLPFFLIFPTIIFLMIITIPPFLFGFISSFTDYSLSRSPLPGKFIGLQNFVTIIGSLSFTTIFKNTITYTLFSVSISLIFGFIIALLLNNTSRFKEVYQTFLLIPMVLTPMVIGLTFKYMYNSQYGIISYFLKLLGSSTTTLLGHPDYSLFSIVIVEIWQWTPFVALVLLSGLEGLPRMPFEAAKMDGASSTQIFFRITMPQLKRVFLVVLLIRLLDAFRSFDLIYAMTRGGPGISTETLIINAWREGFVFFNIGRGAALSILMLYIVQMIAYIILRIIKYK